jgi:hypothetical protein
MSTRLARLVLSLYPLAFRRRYGEEMQALLVDCPPEPRGLLDLLRGALTEHLRPAPGLSENMDVDARLRLGLAGTLACWVLFATAGFAFYNTSEDHPFIAAGDAHPLLGGAHIVVQALAALASAAVIAGALPLVYFALRQAHRQRSRLRAIVGVPIAAVLAFILITAVLVRIANSHQSLAYSHPSSDLAQATFLAWGVVGLLCGGVCVLAARKALFGIGVARAWLIGALWSATFVSMAMIAMACATALYTIALMLDAPGLTGEGNGPFQLVSVGVSLVIVTVAMTLFAALAVSSVGRTWRCVRRSPA